MIRVALRRPNTFVVQAPYQPKTTVSSEELKQRFPTLKVAIGAK